LAIIVRLLDDAGKARDVPAVTAVDRRVGGTVIAQPAVAEVAGRKRLTIEEDGSGELERCIVRLPREHGRFLALRTAEGGVDLDASKGMLATDGGYSVAGDAEKPWTHVKSSWRDVTGEIRYRAASDDALLAVEAEAHATRGCRSCSPAAVLAHCLTLSSPTKLTIAPDQGNNYAADGMFSIIAVAHGDVELQAHIFHRR
jgi:hypothetical protein